MQMIPHELMRLRRRERLPRDHLPILHPCHPPHPATTASVSIQQHDTTQHNTHNYNATIMIMTMNSTHLIRQPPLLLPTQKPKPPRPLIPPHHNNPRMLKIDRSTVQACGSACLEAREGEGEGVLEGVGEAGLV